MTARNMSWRRRVPLVVLLAAVACLPLPLQAHRVQEVEAQLGESERYAQLMNEEAPDFDLQDADGRSFTLEDFHGQAVILNFIYARCKEDCPLHSLKLAEVQAQIEEAGWSDGVQFISVATDTEDAAATAEAMRTHAERFGLDPANWLFLYGGPGREWLGMNLARAYGLEFVEVGEEEQMHGVVTHLIDPGGMLRARYHGLRFDAVSLTTHAAVLAEGGHGNGRHVSGTAGDFSNERPLMGMTEWTAVAVGFMSLGVLGYVAWSFRRGR